MPGVSCPRLASSQHLSLTPPAEPARMHPSKPKGLCPSRMAKAPLVLFYVADAVGFRFPLKHPKDLRGLQICLAKSQFTNAVEISHFSKRGIWITVTHITLIRSIPNFASKSVPATCGRTLLFGAPHIGDQGRQRPSATGLHQTTHPCGSGTCGDHGVTVPSPRFLPPTIPQTTPFVGL